LAHHPAYQIYVWARKGAAGSYTYSNPSDAIIIIDTPITVANGASPSGGPGNAKLTWDPVHSADVLDDTTFANGAYYLRHRRARTPSDSPPSAVDHTQVGWQPGDYATDQLVKASALKDKVTDNGTIVGGTITPLSLKNIYAVQLRYVKSGKPSVFAARDVYVWPSDDPPEEDDIVATYRISSPLGNTLGQPITNRTVEYSICTDTFPPAQANRWAQLIEHAVEQWESSPSLLTVTRVDECTDYTSIINMVALDVRTYLMDPDTQSVPVGTQRTHITNLVTRLTNMGHADRDHADRRRNEIIMFDDGDDTDSNIEYLRGQMVFPQFAYRLGYVDCWKWNPMMNRNNDQVTIACTIRIHHPDNKNVSTADIFLLRSKHVDDPLLKNTANPSDAVFNRCPDTSSDADVIPVVLHEFGHVLGIKGATQGGDDSHPELGQPDPMMRAALTMMGAELNGTYGCSPHPFDVLIVNALFQRS
jgi:hypothetical protein